MASKTKYQQFRRARSPRKAHSIVRTAEFRCGRLSTRRTSLPLNPAIGPISASSAFTRSPPFYLHFEQRRTSSLLLHNNDFFVSVLSHVQIYLHCICGTAMDPLTALSVAGTIVQFVDFSIKLLSTTRKLYRSDVGNLPDHEELEYVTTDLSRLAARLQQPPEQEEGFQPSSPELQEISGKCDEVARELLKRLEALKIEKNNAFRSFRVALQASWSKRDLNELVARLSTYRQSIQTHILADLR
jgi:hypothetical protein